MRKSLFFIISLFLFPLCAGIQDPFNTGVVLDFAHLFSKENRSIGVKLTSDYVDFEINKTKEMIATVRSKVRALRVDYALWDDFSASWERNGRDYLTEGRINQLYADELNLGILKK